MQYMESKHLSKSEITECVLWRLLIQTFSHHEIYESSIILVTFPSKGHMDYHEMKWSVLAGWWTFH